MIYNFPICALVLIINIHLLFMNVCHPIVPLFRYINKLKKDKGYMGYEEGQEMEKPRETHSTTMTSAGQ